MLKLGVIWCGVQQKQSVDIADVKRRLSRLPERLNHSRKHQGRQRASRFFLMFEGQAMVGGCTRVVFPNKGLAQVQQFAVEALNALGFGHRPRANTRRVEKGKVCVIGRRFAPGMQSHEVARIVVQEDRET